MVQVGDGLSNCRTLLDWLGHCVVLFTPHVICAHRLRIDNCQLSFALFDCWQLALDMSLLLLRFYFSLLVARLLQHVPSISEHIRGRSLQILDYFLRGCLHWVLTIPIRVKWLVRIAESVAGKEVGRSRIVLFQVVV